MTDIKNPEEIIDNQTEPEKNSLKRMLIEL